ncbi:hypothetical protein [Microtetraspora malaysiensis]|uniref:MftR C-terminal domain-containing protein n=1 Tax=Microtetraspora malaysiensis TaxID=161358 RepID=A0ABW6T399_9ACTN
MSSHRPRWVALAQLGELLVEQCGHIRITRPGDPVPDPYDVARAGIVAALARAWPDLARRDPARIEALADVALDAVAPGPGPRSPLERRTSST